MIITELRCKVSLVRRPLLERVSLTLSATSLTSKTPSFSKRARAVLKRASWLSVRTTETTGAVPPTYIQPQASTTVTNSRGYIIVCFLSLSLSLSLFFFPFVARSSVRLPNDSLPPYQANDNSVCWEKEPSNISQVLPRERMGLAKGKKTKPATK